MNIFIKLSRYLLMKFTINRLIKVTMNKLIKFTINRLVLLFNIVIVNSRLINGIDKTFNNNSFQIVLEQLVYKVHIS